MCLAAFNMKFLASIIVKNTIISRNTCIIQCMHVDITFVFFSPISYLLFSRCYYCLVYLTSALLRWYFISFPFCLMLCLKCALR